MRPNTCYLTPSVSKVIFQSANFIKALSDKPPLKSKIEGEGNPNKLAVEIESKTTGLSRGEIAVVTKKGERVLLTP